MDITWTDMGLIIVTSPGGGPSRQAVQGRKGVLGRLAKTRCQTG